MADNISFGAAPALVLFNYWINEIPQGFEPNTLWQEIIPYFALIIAAAAGYRLAKFNIDEDQQTYFKGLPTPANALLIISLPLIIEFQNNDLMNSIIVNKWFLIGLTVLSCYMLNSNIKLFALKFKNWGFKDNATRYIFIIMCLLFLIIWQFAAIPLIILLYIGMSVLDNITSKKV